MSKTTIKKGTTVNVKTKSGASYSYKFITLAQIHDWLDDNGLSYEATIKRVDDREYMFITKIDKDGNRGEPLQGSRVPSFNPKDTTRLAELMQDYGSVLTMARRYSLMMVYGLAPADEAESGEKPKSEAPIQGSAEHLDFQELRLAISKTNQEQLDEYRDEVLKQDLTPRQRQAVTKIFGDRGYEIIRHSMLPKSKLKEE